MDKNLIVDFIKSWQNRNGNINKTEDLLLWIKTLNEETYVNINECSILDSDFWFYDSYKGEVLNRKQSFFSITGMRYFENDIFIKEQPIIIQPEIGYLGIICKKIDGVLNFLMQAKIEPGNVNCVQISPTIQATKSNFLRAHGGNVPRYFELFKDSSKHHVIYDQIQSEQASRFYKKRNRNMILFLNEDIEVFPNYKWMTLGQIKELMSINNLVNMDTRTVLSGIPFSAGFDYLEREDLKLLIKNNAWFASIFYEDPQSGLPELYQKLNNYKMFKEFKTLPIPLNKLIDWKIDEYGIACDKQADFMVRYYDIEISGREVRHWIQPLFKAIGEAVFGLLTRVKNDKREFLVKIKSEIGSFDIAEIGPCIQWEPTHHFNDDDSVEALFRRKFELNKDILVNVILSEEGGRFYHEQNRNVIIHINEKEILEIPEDYIWMNLSSLNYLVQVNNCLNIQLRNLMSLIDL